MFYASEELPLDIGIHQGLTLEEMDEVFGDQKGLAIADQERQDAIHRQLGLLHDTDEKRHSDEKRSHSQDRSNET